MRVITTMERIIERRKREGKRDLTTIEVSEILTTGFYDDEKYNDKQKSTKTDPHRQPADAACQEPPAMPKEAK